MEQLRPDRRRVALAALLALLAGPASGATSLDVGQGAGFPGATVELEVRIEADGDATHLQLDLLFDPADLDAGVAVAGGALSDHVLEAEVLSPGALRLLVYSLSATSIASGELVSIPFTIAPGVAAGIVPVDLAGVLVADGAGARVDPVATTGGGVIVLGDEAVPEIPTLGPPGAVVLALLLLGTALRLSRRSGRLAPPGAAAIGAALLAGALAGSAALLAAVLAGDANADGSVDGDDVPVIAGATLGRAAAAGDADCNGDGSTDILDIGGVIAGTCGAAAPTPTRTSTPSATPTATPSATPSPTSSPTPGVTQSPTSTPTPTVTATPTTIATPTGEGEAPDLAVVPDQAIVEGRLLAVQLSATDPDLPNDVLRFSLPVVPVGMSIDPADGSILWSPRREQAGTHSVTARVTDASGRSDEEIFQIEVGALGSPPSLAPIANQTVVEGTTVSVQAQASDPDAGDVLTYSLALAPDGMTIGAATGTIAWTPTAAQLGAHDATVEVEDPRGLLDFTSFIVTVASVNEAPLARDDSYTARIDETLSVVAAEGVLANDEDPNGDPLAAQLVTPPALGTLDLAPDGSFDYTPTPPVFGGTQPVLLREIRTTTTAGLTVGMPVVVDLDGDRVPEIVFLTQGAFADRHLVAANGATGEILWSVPGWLPENDPPIGLCAACALTATDLTGDGVPEILAVQSGSTTFPQLPIDTQWSAWDASGNLLFVGTDIRDDPQITASSGFRHRVATADLDGDEVPEVVAGYAAQGPGHPGCCEEYVTVWNADGTIRWTAMGAGMWGGSNPGSNNVLIHDIDLDGRPEVIYGDQVWDADGNLVWASGHRVDDVMVLNLDDDAYPELVYRGPFAQITVVDHTGDLVWQTPLGHAGVDTLSAADLDDDGLPEIVLPGSNSVIAYRANGAQMWSTTFPVATNGGFATIFDLNGDREPEVLYQGRTGGAGNGTLYVLAGPDGAILHSVDAPVFNTFRGPVVADLDGDGHAEILTQYSTGFANAIRLRIFGPAEGVWERSRPVWNQTPYYVTHVKPTGAVAFPAVPNWLLPGLNNHMVNVRLPEEREEEHDTFRYLANDGALDSNVATVHLTVRHDHPPEIVSAPKTRGTIGIPYRYPVLAVDADPGDVLEFSKGAGPAAMTVDPALGVVRWTPGPADLGLHQVGVRVEDTQHNVVFQVFELEVLEPVSVPDVVGLAQDAAGSSIGAAGLVVGATSTASHPTIASGLVAAQSPPAGSVAEAGSAVALVLSTGPGPADTDNDGDGFTENEGDCDDGAPGVHPGAADTDTDGVDQNCDGQDGTLPISQLVVQPEEPTILVGGTVAFQAVAVFSDSTSQNVTAAAVWSSTDPSKATIAPGGVATGAAEGTTTIQATFKGAPGATTLHVFGVVTDDAPPTVDITTPAAAATVIGPIDVVGTATDPNFLKYELAYAPAGETEFTPLVTRTTPVVNGVLGQFDPTLLLNDLYDLRLTVFDRGGNALAFDVVVQVDGSQKVGNFSLAFTDLQIPLSGLPITVNRVYDSRDLRLGDFGVGWRLDVQTLTCRANRVQGTGWAVVKSGLSFVLTPTDAHRVSLALPDGRVESFELSPTPTASPLIPFSFLTARYIARPGTLGKLQPLSNTGLLILDPQPGNVELLDDSTFDPYQPDRFRYTGPDGREIVLRCGQAVESLKDSNGNTLTFGASGIVHSSGPAVSFERDALGRIVRLTDPEGNQQSYVYNGEGDLAAHTDPAGNETRFFYDRAHHLIRIEDPLGRPAFRNEYDDAGRLIAATDARGGRFEFDHDLDAGETVSTDPEGNSIKLSFDARGNVVERQRTVTIAGVPVLTTERWEYDDRDLETAHVDADGRRTELAYDSRDQLTKVTIDPAGLRLIQSFTYDATGNLLAATDGEGRTRSFAYDSRGNVVRATDGEGNTTQFVYDASGRITELLDPFATSTAFEFDSFGHLAHRVVRHGGGPVISEERFEHDRNGNLLSSTSYPLVGGAPTEAVTRFTYDEDNRVVSSTDPLGHTTRIEFDAGGNVVARIDALGRRAAFTYDAVGNLVGTELPDGTSITHQYDALGRRVRTSDQAARVSEFRYDEAGRVVSALLPDGATYQRIYTPAGRLAATVEGGGGRTDFAYDPAGRRLRVLAPQVIDGTTGLPVRPETRFEYDDSGKLQALIDPNGRRTEFTYDERRLLARTAFADGTSVVQSYDAAGRPSQIVDEEGRITELRYDARGLLVEIIQPSPAPGAPRPVTTYAYDGAGLPVSRTDALGRTTSFHYDLAGRLVRHLLPGGQSEGLTYDAVGNVTAFRDFAGRTVAVDYDQRNRPVRRLLPGGAVETMAYTLTGQRATVNDEHGTWSYAYDAADRLASLTRPDGVTLDYRYDGAGRLIELATGASTFTYDYDAAGRLIEVEGPQGAINHAYDAAGNLLRTAAPNGTATTRVYDQRNRMVDLAHLGPGGVTTLASYAYELSPSGRRQAVVERDGSRETYSYDRLDRLIAETRTGSHPRSISYQYDLVGNRTRAVRDGAGLDYTYDVNDRLKTAGGASFAYDANGNLVRAEENGSVTDYEFDALDRLVGVDSPTGTMSFGYDVDGRRILEEGPSGLRRLVVDDRNPSGLAQVVEERNGAGSVVSSYTHGPALQTASLAGASRVFHADAVGSTRLLTDATGAVSAEYLYDSFGGLREQSGGLDNPYRFAGERLDPVASSYHLRAREYDPSLGRFLSRDPFPGLTTDPVTFHPYLYARCSPASFTDPTGLFSIAEISVVQTIQSIMKDIDFVAKAQTACRAKGALGLAGVVIGLTQLAAELLVDPEGNRASSSELVLLHISNVEPTGGDALIGRRGFLGEDLQELLITYDNIASALKVSTAFRSGHSQELTIPLDGSGVSGEAAFGADAEIFILQACGVRFGAVSLIAEVKASVSVKASAKSFASQFEAQAEVSTSFEVETVVLKQEIPFFSARVGKGGFGPHLFGR